MLLLRPHMGKNKVTKIEGNFIYFKTPMFGEQLPVIKKITFLNAILKIQVNNILVKKSYVRDSMIIYQQSVYRQSSRPFKLSLKSGSLAVLTKIGRKKSAESQILKKMIQTSIGVKFCTKNGNFCF